MKSKFLPLLTLTTVLLPATLRAEDGSKWSFDASLFGLAAGMSGNAAVKGVPANVDVGFDQIWDHLKFGAMGGARVGYDRWGLSTEFIYMDLESVKGPFTARAQQWLVQPALEYRVCENFTAYAGTRYNNIHLALHGPLGVNPSGTQDWWDPIVGGRCSLPLGKKFSLQFTGDVGGFGLGSDLTWQAFPFLSWQVTEHGSVQVGYRLLYTDYETGSGANRFRYDMLTSGPQVGFSYHF